jgi:hypothetical protein
MGGVFHGRATTRMVGLGAGRKGVIRLLTKKRPVGQVTTGRHRETFTERDTGLEPATFSLGILRGVSDFHCLVVFSLSWMG